MERSKNFGSSAHVLSVLLVTTVLSLLCYSPVAYASFIKITPTTDNLALQITEESLTITGSITLLNEGDESALNAFPRLSFAKTNLSTQWSGPSVDLRPKSQHTWAITYTIPFSSEACKEISCASLKGKYPLFMEYLYEDINAYKLSAPLISILTTTNLTESQKSISFSYDPITARIACEELTKTASCTATLMHRFRRDTAVTLTPYTSNQLNARVSPSVISLTPLQDEREISVSLTNFSGLVGSSYPVFLIFSWQNEDGTDQVVFTKSVTKIVPKSSYYLFVIGALLLCVICWYTIKSVRLFSRSKE